MKKVLFAVTIIATLGFSVTSCKSEEKKETEEITTEVVEEVKEIKVEIKEEMAMATYQCPMKCEEGKTYDAPGQCPVCEMDLKEVKVDV
ncbi:MAG: transcription initiation factor IIE alpha subunit [Flavobacteriaceae bacterium]|jgi:transcription initiation factor IIE alpha subunit